MATLTHLKAREVLDSRGRPTVEVEATASTGAVANPSLGPSAARSDRANASADANRVSGSYDSARITASHNATGNPGHRSCNGTAPARSISRATSSGSTAAKGFTPANAS